MSSQICLSKFNMANLVSSYIVCLPCAWLCSHWVSVSSNHHKEMLPSKEWIMFMSSSLKAYYMVVDVAQEEQLLTIPLLSELVGVNVKTSNTRQQLSCWRYYKGTTHTQYTVYLFTCPTLMLLLGLSLSLELSLDIEWAFLILLKILSSSSPLKHLTLCFFPRGPWEWPKQKCVWTFLCKGDSSSEHLRLYSILSWLS